MMCFCSKGVTVAGEYTCFTSEPSTVTAWAAIFNNIGGDNQKSLIN
jgi:hypothetical protein